MIEWKIPCELCGERDVEIQAAWPAEHHPQGHTHEVVIVHWNGDRCYPLRQRVEVAAAAPADSKRAARALLPAAIAAARRRRLSYPSDMADQNENELVTFTGLANRWPAPEPQTPPAWSIAGGAEVGVYCPLCKRNRPPLVGQDDLLCGVCLHVMVTFGRLGS